MKKNVKDTQNCRLFENRKLRVLKTSLVQRRTKTQKYKGALFEKLESGWAYPLLVEDETEQKARQQNKTQGSKRGKQIINQNIGVLAPLEYGAGTF